MIDISPRIGAGAPVWPGDTELAIETAWDPAAGSSVTVCKVTMSPHTGAHADAPLHVGAGPGDAASLPLEAFWGPCFVFDAVAAAEIDAAVASRALAAAAAAGSCERLLFRTQATVLESFPESFPHFTLDGATALASRSGPAGLRLVGIDTFSVDRADSKDLPAHRAFFAAGIVILEGLDLSRVAAGAYELVALPLALAGADASPVRAALRPMSQR